MEQLVLDINMLMEYIIFFYVIFQKQIRKPQKLRGFALVVCLAVWIGSLIAGFGWSGVSVGPFSVKLLWIYIIIGLIFEVSFNEIVVWGIGQWLILSMLESLLYVMLQTSILNQFILDNMIIFMISATLLLFYAFMRKKGKNRTLELPLRMWIILDAIMLVLTAMMTFFLYTLMRELPENRTMMMGRLLSVVGGVVIVILLFFMLYYCNSAYVFRRQKELAEIEKRQQRDYFLQLLEREEETRRFRHDIINDLLEIRNYCENKNCGQMKHYLEKTLGVVQKISQSSYDVGNDIVNTVINYYLRPLKETCTIEVNGYMSEKLSIDERDLCVLTANILKNASEAVCNMDHGKIWVQIDEGEKYLSFQVSNTFEGAIQMNRRGVPITTKQDKRNHGFGTRNVMDIVKKNDGRYQVKAEDGIYQVEIILKR